MVGHTHEVHGGLDLDVVSQRVLDGFALCVMEGISRAGEAVAHEPGIHRPAGVDVFLAEVCVAIRILLEARLGLCRSGPAGLLCRFWGF